MISHDSKCGLNRFGEVGLTYHVLQDGTRAL